MMMSLLWYYRPEHTESDRLPRHIGCEIFASKHWDQTSVACIDDKCHVLTFNEYCRYGLICAQSDTAIDEHRKAYFQHAKSPE